MKFMRILFIFFITIVLNNDGAKSYCSCWDDWHLGPGPNCGGTIDWDTTAIDLHTCVLICKDFWPNFEWSYIDGTSNGHCKKKKGVEIKTVNDGQANLYYKINNCSYATDPDYPIRLRFVLSTDDEDIKYLSKLDCSALLPHVPGHPAQAVKSGRGGNKKTK